MSKYFSGTYLKGEFQMFSPTHIIVLLVLTALIALQVVWLRRVKNEKVKH